MFYRLPRVPVKSPLSELFITQLDRVLSNLLQFICFEKGCWTTGPSGLFQPQLLHDSTFQRFNQKNNYLKST